MFDFFEDFFNFLSSDATAGEDPFDPIEDTIHDGFNAWQAAADDFFVGLGNAAKPWGDPAEDFVSAWQQATESFASQFANWFGWKNDDSPV